MDISRIDGSFSRWDDLLEMILASFAYMEGRIDPPSSALRLTPANLAEKAAREIAYVALEGHQILACVFLRPEADCLYIGKLAVAPDVQGRGIGRQLVAVAEEVARATRLPALRLETRIELVENHAAFAALGFVRTAENAHPGFSRATSVEMRKAIV
ncbi:GNAT family N-acetyltransferase [Sinorhizobium sp. BG8]|uniref:GNAT family N-acetyltransferase n=1 Tax=Sinorhizobium sp. BG8 TaxID=2613773 RepID=UPI00193C8BCB|nr:GNAT family N-acetyltransferase [Sinorhizobium sp. BG8]QRM53748.1 GNAT family N-acetyltransferase [Sinorhizobium sp. BG8]